MSGFDETLAALQGVRWGSSPDWSARARELVGEYYRRAGAFVPAERKRFEPVDRALEAVVSGLPDGDRARVQQATAELLAAAKARGERVESTTARLVPLVLAWSLGALAADRDPGAPLVELFRAGFQLAYTHAGIEIWYAGSSMTMPVPVR